MTIVVTVVAATLIPAVAAALGLAPTARIAKPVVDRSSSHHTPAAAASATKKPRWSSSNSAGNMAVGCTSGEIGSLRPGRMNGWVLSSQDSMPAAM